MTEKRIFDAVDTVAREASTWAGAELQSLGLASERRGLAEIAIVEAFMNIVKHGYAGAPGTVECEARRAAEMIELELTDAAPPFNPLEFIPKDRRGDEQHGMGLTIIRESTDAQDYARIAEKNRLILKWRAPVT